MNILKANPGTTQEEIANKINKSVRTVKNYMAEMQERGLIERKNGKKNGEWIVNWIYNNHQKNFNIEVFLDKSSVRKIVRQSSTYFYYNLGMIISRRKIIWNIITKI